MRPLAVLPVALAVVLSGCTLPGGEEEDPAARAPPEAVSVRFDHDFLGNGRNLPFRLETSTGTITVRVELRQNEGHPACMPDRTPPRVTLFRPFDERVWEVVAPIGEGGAKASGDGSGDCSVVEERTFDRARGAWRVGFTGSGNFTGVVTVTGPAG